MSARFFDGVAGRALLVTLTRIANQGLVILSPVLLVRFLTVEEFGQYREFLLYSTFLISIGVFGIQTSLLYFIPRRPARTVQYARQALILIGANSTLVVLAALVLNALLGGAVLGEYAWPVAAYVLLFVNLDVWEYLWLSEKRTKAVFAYTSGRLLARMMVVICVAWVTGDVRTIITALVLLEGLRFAGSWIAWRRFSRAKESTDAPVPMGEEDSWREQLRYCMPVGASLLLVVGNRSVGGLFVAKLLGPVALAHYAIGTYVQPIVTVLRNSISDVLLPEMVGRKTPQDADRLNLWRRATIVTAILLVPTGIVLARYAEQIVVTLFSGEYLPAVLLFQVYLLVLLRECFDFSVPLRALGTTQPIVHSNLIALLLNLGLMLVLMPRVGLIGAVVAFVISRFVEGIYLGWRMQRLYELSIGQLANWGDLLKVGAAATVASSVLGTPWWTEALGVAGIIVAGIMFAVVFALMLWLLRLPEAVVLIRRMWRPICSFLGPFLGIAPRQSGSR